MPAGWGEVRGGSALSDTRHWLRGGDPGACPEMFPSVPSPGDIPCSSPCSHMTGHMPCFSPRTCCWRRWDTRTEGWRFHFALLFFYLCPWFLSHLLSDLSLSGMQGESRRLRPSVHPALCAGPDTTPGSHSFISGGGFEADVAREFSSHLWIPCTLHSTVKT